MNTSMKGVEIFAAGTWNGDKYTVRDLDDIVQAFHALDYRPAVKVGHVKDKPGDPAYGWVTNLRRVDHVLMADFEHMHDSVAAAIRERRFDRVSAEIYHNLKRRGKVYRLALRAVALLGVEPPAVADLVPLHRVEFSQGEYSEAEYFPLEWEETQHSASFIKGVAMNRAILEASDEELRRSYSSDRYKTERIPSGSEVRVDRGKAGAEVHDLCMQLIDANPKLSYHDALMRLTRTHPDLIARYRGIAPSELTPVHAEAK